MGIDKVTSTQLIAFFNANKIATLAEIKKTLNTTSTMTVFRKLRSIGYLSSYSRRGKYYTLWNIPEFNEIGLWSFNTVCFSKYGNLIETSLAFVNKSDQGYGASELEHILHADAKHALLKLYKTQRITREKIDGHYIYMSSNKSRQIQQRLLRQNRPVELSSDGVPVMGRMTDEVEAAIILFYSLLDEKQRRLYAGLESHKYGHGGDSKIAGILGLDNHTVAKGRQEILSGQMERERIRQTGGGRKRIEKKRRES